VIYGLAIREIPFTIGLATKSKINGEPSQDGNDAINELGSTKMSKKFV
jgi:hypothetical protein